MLKEVNPTETLKVVSLGLLQSYGVPEGELLSDLLTATKFSTHGELLGLNKKKKTILEDADGQCLWLGSSEVGCNGSESFGLCLAQSIGEAFSQFKLRRVVFTFVIWPPSWGPNGLAS